MWKVNLAGIDLNLLTPLAALLEERHVSRAARRAGLSQPAMSRALARMREAFGDELLVRGTHGYELTQRAEQLRQELETLLPRIEALVNGQVFDPATATTTFRITATDAATTILGPVVAARLRAVAPNVTLAFQAWNDHVIDDLERGRTDIVFRAVDAPAAMRSAHLVDDEFVCLLSAEHPLSERKRLALDEYLSCVHLEVNLGESGQFVIETRLAALGSARVVAVSIPYHAAAIAAVRGTDLVANAAPAPGRTARLRPRPSPRRRATRDRPPQVRDGLAPAPGRRSCP